MTDIIETENGRTYINRVPPCGHTNGTHPGGCWWMAVCDAVIAERARIVAAVKGLEDPRHEPPWFDDDHIVREDVLRVIEGETP